MSDAAATAAQIDSAGRKHGLTLSGTAIQGLITYVETLLFWRKRMSLTTAATAEEIIDHHIADSLALVPHVPVNGRIADIGSGAGFPGIPIAIVLPGAQIVLIESRRKRTSFLREVLRKLQLSNAQVAEGRAEELVQGLRGNFDAVTARAFGSIKDFLDISEPMLRVGGIAFAMKGPRGKTELVSHDGFGGPDVSDYELEGLGNRTICAYTRR